MHSSPEGVAGVRRILLLVLTNLITAQRVLPGINYFVSSMAALVSGPCGIDVRQENLRDV